MKAVRHLAIICRSREGAWIEIASMTTAMQMTGGRSREGAWIEMKVNHPLSIGDCVAPVRERGLKCPDKAAIVQRLASLP